MCDGDVCVCVFDVFCCVCVWMCDGGEWGECVGEYCVLK